MKISEEDLARRARELDWLLFDCDGVLTDGGLVYGPEGELWKVFHVRDGVGLKLAKEAGLKIGILSGRGNAALEARAREGGVDALSQNPPETGAALPACLA